MMAARAFILVLHILRISIHCYLYHHPYTGQLVCVIFFDGQLMTYMPI